MAGVTTTAAGYGARHQQIRAELSPLVLAGRVRCARCGEPIAPGEPWDLGHDDHDRRKYTGPEHLRCNRATSGRLALGRRLLLVEEPEPERDGLDPGDPCWQVPWLRGLRRVPADATWPRLMTVPHPSAAGSLGPEFIAWAEARSGRPLRWWQRLVATRLLEVNGAGELCWEVLILSMARQLGKSWLLREILLWRIHQGDRFGEPQDCLHTGKDLAVTKEVQRPARLWAKGRSTVYRVREVNGQEEIELLEDGSRWMLRAKEAVYGYSVSLGAVDEAWKVRLSTVDEGLVPTMVERVQPQLLLVSTAHRLATALMVGRRQAALEHLDTAGGDLLIEWSTPHDADLDDVAGWRLASPHWTAKRERLIDSKLDAMRAGTIEDPDEPDPEQSFRSQWLNQWPRVLTDVGKTEPLLPPGFWASLAEQGVSSLGPIWVAIEDDFGLGAAVAAAARMDDGRLEVDGWTRPDWDTAIEDVRRLAEHRRVRKFLVGASLLDRVPAGFGLTPHPIGSRETKLGLALLRDLVANGQVVHDQLTFQLDEALSQARVREASSGLMLQTGGGAQLVKAAVWAVHAAHRPTPEGRIY